MRETDSQGLHRRGKISPHPTWKVLALAASDLLRCLPQLLVCDILFKVVAFVLFTPVMGWLFRLFVATSGSGAVGNADILMFLLSPAALAALAVIVPAGFAVAFLEFAGLMAIGHGAARDREVTWFEALRFAFRRSARIVGVGLLWLLASAAAVLPFAAGALLTYVILLSGHDINYYLHLNPPEFRRAVVIAAGLAAGAFLVLAFLFVSLAFSLPVVLFGNDPVRLSFRRSLRLLRTGKRVVGSALAVWLFLWLAVAAAVNAILFQIGHLLVAAAGEKMALLLLALGSLTAVNGLVSAALIFLGTAFGCLLLVRLYFQVGGEEAARSTRPPGERGPLDERPRWSVPRKALLAAAGACLVVSVATAYGLLENLALEDRVAITAHRGSSLAAPENTLSAVEQAIADGADFVEFDVQETADGVVVVTHDADLMRVGGSPLVIGKSTYGALREIDVGSHFAPPFSGERIPTLDEVIDTARGRIKLNVELKNYGGDGRRLAKKVVDILATRGMKGESVIMSLKYGEVQAVRQFDPTVTVGFTSSVALGDISLLDCDFLAVGAALARDALIAAAHDQGKEVHVWTIDAPVDISLMIDRGVDNIITNDPAAVVRVLEDRRELTNTERLLLRFKSLYL